MAPPLTPLVLRHLNAMFTDAERSEALVLLTDGCGTNLPMTTEWERIRIAALKVSGGDLAGLYSAIQAAQEDWRDLLVEANFADDTKAHLSWCPP